MAISQQSQFRTQMFARVLGPYLVVVAATALVRWSHLQTVVSQFNANSVWPWVTGAFVLIAGLTVVALHQYWRGAAAIIVSALGWLAALKGLLLVAFPDSLISVANSVVDGSGWWRVLYVVVALAGLYLTYVGWSPQTRPASHDTTATRDLPRAA
ncbi:hypothetical protein [Mycolicibacterium sp.]|uniref:hypothetical protein n=1 Tax=Mycolicibacterium TaxID=1866885 RepID=UPI00148FAD08|nr:hypothetical protein [Mycolicibacterium fortuitum]